MKKSYKTLSYLWWKYKYKPGKARCKSSTSHEASNIINIFEWQHTEEGRNNTDIAMAPQSKNQGFMHFKPSLCNKFMKQALGKPLAFFLQLSKCSVRSGLISLLRTLTTVLKEYTNIQVCNLRKRERLSNNVLFIFVNKGQRFVSRKRPLLRWWDYRQKHHTDGRINFFLLHQYLLK